jgi:hypothetical protein
MTLNLNFKVNEFLDHLFLEGGACEPTQNRRDRPNRVIFVRVTWVFVLFQAYDLEFDLEGQSISWSFFPQRQP